MRRAAEVAGMSLRLGLLVAAVLLLAACGSKGPFRDRGFDYLLAKPVSPLVYPEGLRPIPAQELYPIEEVEQRRAWVAGKKKQKLDIPRPPQLIKPDEMPDEAAVPDADKKILSAARVVHGSDGNGYPVLMLDMAFSWAWQAVGDALKTIDGIKVEDLDRERAIYYVAIKGKRSSAGEPYQLKLNYTSNGIQVALQINENTLADTGLAAPLMKSLREGMLQ